MAANVRSDCAQVESEWANEELVPFLDLVFGKQKGYRSRAPAAWLKDVRRAEQGLDDIVSTAPGATILYSPCSC
jgi:hypothetical protein